jgi:hypothetical protein
MRRIRDHMTYANVMATIAVFGVLAGGGAYAASKIGPSDIAKHAVHSRHINKKAVKTSKIGSGAVTGGKLGGGAVRAPNLGAITEVSKTVNIPGSNQDQARADCREGTRRIGGGAASAVFGMPISESRPVGTTGWEASARNNNVTAVDLTVYVLCLKG